MGKYLKFVLVILLVLAGGFTLVGSYVVWFVIPRGVGLHGGSYCSANGLGPTGNSTYALGMDRADWIWLHNWASVALFVLIFLHIIIHWKWIAMSTKRMNVGTLSLDPAMERIRSRRESGTSTVPMFGSTVQKG